MRSRAINLTRLSLVVQNEGTHHTSSRSRSISENFLFIASKNSWHKNVLIEGSLSYIIPVEGGRTIQGDVLIKESALNELVS